MMKKLNTIRRAAYLIFFYMIAQFWTLPAMAQLTIGQMGQNGAKNVHGVGFLVWMVGLLVGFALVIAGIVKLAHHRNSKEGLMTPILLILCGALACASPKIVGMVQSSFLGSSSAQTTMSQLNVGS